jgi:hypothetical protein
MYGKTLYNELQKEPTGEISERDKTMYYYRARRSIPLSRGYRGYRAANFNEQAFNRIVDEIERILRDDFGDYELNIVTDESYEIDMGDVSDSTHRVEIIVPYDKAMAVDEQFNKEWLWDDLMQSGNIDFMYDTKEVKQMGDDLVVIGYLAAPW